MTRNIPTYRLTITEPLSACKLLVRLEASGLVGPDVMSAEDRKLLERFGEGGDFSARITVSVRMNRNTRLRRAAHLSDTQLWLHGICTVEPLEEQPA